MVRSGNGSNYSRQEACEGIDWVDEVKVVIGGSNVC